jgi:DNA-binding GntR family transcriptional regulator
MLGPSTSAERTAYDYLRQRILTGAYPGGTPILQQQVADDLGISRIPVRDALKHLSAEGLVKIESNRRVVVAAMTVADVREMFLMSSVLEGLAAREAAMRMTPEILDRLSVLARRMELAESHVDDWLAIHEDFHSLIAAQSQMPRLQREIRIMRAAAESYLRAFLMKHGVGELKGVKHGPLLAALKRRDADLAERAARSHLESAFQELCEVIERNNRKEAVNGRERRRPLRGV